MMIAGQIAPQRGAADIWALLAGEPAQYPEIALPMIGLISEWQDNPEHRDAYAVDMLDEARELLRKLPKPA